jgi:hypothetical protein
MAGDLGGAIGVRPLGLRAGQALLAEAGELGDTVSHPDHLPLGHDIGARSVNLV